MAYFIAENLKQIFDAVSIDNEVHVNLSSMIVHNATNYFIGKPVTHAYSDTFKNNGIGNEHIFSVKSFKSNDFIHAVCIISDIENVG